LNVKAQSFNCTPHIVQKRDASGLFGCYLIGSFIVV
jgi:hypothetical protein